MVEVAVHHDNVVFTVKGRTRYCAFKNQLTIPRAHITEVRHDPEAARRIEAASGRWAPRAGRYHRRHILPGQPTQPKSLLLSTCPTPPMLWWWRCAMRNTTSSSLK